MKTGSPNNKDAAMRNDEIKAAIRDVRWRLNANCCRICGKRILQRNAKMANRAMDHDHESGLVRDMLCFPCNGGLGAYEKGSQAGAISRYRECGGSLSPESWLRSAKLYCDKWRRRCEVLRAAFEPHGDICQVKPGASIPDAMRADVLDAVIRLAEEERGTTDAVEIRRVRGTVPSKWQDDWADEWGKIAAYASADRTTWKVALAAVSYLLIALEWFPEIRRVLASEADEADAKFHPPELREIVRSGLALVAVSFGDA